MIRFLFIGLALALGAAPVLANEPPSSGTTVTLSLAQMFEFAARAGASGDFASAEAAYRALATNPDVEVRTEARFRLALMLADQLNRPRDAAIQLRAILDEKPDAARVRLELARMQAIMGHAGAAEREFRAAQAGGLPPEVERLVQFYANALSARKSVGGSFELAIAPDSNINRSTRSDTLGTILGDFELSDDAKEQSGVGLDLRGQVYFRTGIDQRAQLLVRLSGSADIYRQSQFDDMAVSLQAGPEIVSGRDRFSLAGGATWRWYGLDPYTMGWGASGEYRHPIGTRSQLNAEISAQHVDNLRNDLQDGDSFVAAVRVDHAIDPRTGGGIGVSASRQTARDPGYALAGGGVNGYLFRELGKTTLVLAAGYNRLEADQRLFFYPRRRSDERFSASLSATFRALRIEGCSPLARLRWERNKSSVELYDYKRIAGEIGIASAF